MRGIRYLIYREDNDYTRIVNHSSGGKTWKNCEIAYTLRQAIKWARKMGKGTIIQRDFVGKRNGEESDIFVWEGD